MSKENNESFNHEAMLGKQVEILRGPYKGKIAQVTSIDLGDFALAVGGHKIWNGNLTYFPASWVKVITH